MDRDTASMRQLTTAPAFDPALIARYDVAGPRYTSYPTAPHFHDGFDEAALREAIHASNAGTGARGLSVYLHVPFCFSPCFYCGCHRVITRDPTKATQYMGYVEKELALLGPLLGGRPVQQLHLGGGTPNFLDIAHLERWFGALDRHLTLGDEDRQYGIEIDPRHANAAYVAALGRLGFNRMSIGIQDFDPAVQVAVNRLQSTHKVQDIMDAACCSGFRSISVDLIYGLPRQTLENFDRTLTDVITLAPDRIAVYGYAHLPHLFKAQQQIDEADLPDAATRLALFGRALERLCGAGYVYIGMDHFARADDELSRAQRAGSLQRNFQGYSTHGDCDIIGLGVTAIGRIAHTYSQNARDLVNYYAALDAGRLPLAKGLVLSADDLIRRDAISEIMCHGVLSMPAFGARHSLVFGDYFARSLERLAVLAGDGLVSIDAEAIHVTSRGRLLLRNIAMCFDAYLDPSSPAARYSRTI